MSQQQTTTIGQFKQNLESLLRELQADLDSGMIKESDLVTGGGIDTGGYTDSCEITYFHLGYSCFEEDEGGRRFFEIGVTMTEKD